MTETLLEGIGTCNPCLEQVCGGVIKASVLRGFSGKFRPEIDSNMMDPLYFFHTPIRELKPSLKWALECGHDISVRDQMNLRQSHLGLVGYRSA